MLCRKDYKNTRITSGKKIQCHITLPKKETPVCTSWHIYIINIFLSIFYFLFFHFPELRFDLPSSYKFHKHSSVDIEVDFVRFSLPSLPTGHQRSGHHSKEHKKKASGTWHRMKWRIQRDGHWTVQYSSVVYGIDLQSGRTEVQIWSQCGNEWPKHSM